MKKLRFNKKTKNILLIVLSCIMLFGAIFGLVALFRQDKTTKEVNPTYSVGALDHNTGKYVETKSAIYTKDGIECQGLTTTLDFDAVVKYQLYFYSEHDEFVHTSGTLDGVFHSSDVPVYAKYVRIVIVPNEDEEITFFEKFGYAKQLTVEVNKEQNFKSFGENLFAVDTEIGSNKAFDYDDGKTIIESFEAIVSKSIEVTNKRNCLYISVPSSDGSRPSYGIYQYDKDGNFLRYANVLDFTESIYNVSTGTYHFTGKLSSDVGSIRVFCNINASDSELYLY